MPYYRAYWVDGLDNLLRPAYYSSNTSILIQLYAAVVVWRRCHEKSLTIRVNEWKCHIVKCLIASLLLFSASLIELVRKLIILTAHVYEAPERVNHVSQIYVCVCVCVCVCICIYIAVLNVGFKVQSRNGTCSWFLRWQVTWPLLWM